MYSVQPCHSTSLSAALGVAAGRDFLKKKFKVAALSKVWLNDEAVWLMKL